MYGGLPLAYGFLAGVTVLIGAMSMYWLRERANGRTMGMLQGMAGGILAYIALETGGGVAEYVEELARPSTAGEFLLAAVVTTAAFALTYLALAGVERRAYHLGRNPTLLTALIIALAFGVHNVGEGFAIAAGFLAGAVASVVLYTGGFAVHNATEGFAIVGPIIGERGVPVGTVYIVGLSLLAGLPTVLGASIYYAGVDSEMFIAVLNTVATASIVYAMLHVNLHALSRLGGVSSPSFWLAVTLGVVVAFGTESAVLFAMA